ncbi:MAG: hypothetical protein IPL10_03580 [Bacteroidetes bacterium]|nr:hypothetical protein [Bacteroidota bacterium]
MNKIILILISFVILTSCGDKAIKNNVPDKTKNLPWNRITIRLHRQAIFIYKGDSAQYNTWNYKDSVASGSVYKNPVDYKVTKFFLSKSEQDSLYFYCYDIITKPVFVDSTVSCFHCSEIQVCIRNDKSSLCFGYTSVPGWQTMSPSFKNIYRLLKAKTDFNAAD